MTCRCAEILRVEAEAEGDAFHDRVSRLLGAVHESGDLFTKVGDSVGEKVRTVQRQAGNHARIIRREFFAKYIPSLMSGFRM